MIKEIANWMIKKGTEETTSGNYCVYADEIAKQFGVSEQWVAEHQDDICEEVDTHREILSETWTSITDGVVVFDMNFGTDYCEWVHDDSNIGCSDCPDNECTGNCMSCNYRTV